jgi:hypothetical protein
MVESSLRDLSYSSKFYQNQNLENAFVVSRVTMAGMWGYPARLQYIYFSTVWMTCDCTLHGGDSRAKKHFILFRNLSTSETGDTWRTSFWDMLIYSCECMCMGVGDRNKTSRKRQCSFAVVLKWCILFAQDACLLCTYNRLPVGIAC